MKTILPAILLLSSVNTFAIDEINLNTFTAYTGNVYFNKSNVTDRLISIECTNHNKSFKLLCKYKVHDQDSGVFSSKILKSTISEDFNTVTVLTP